MTIVRTSSRRLAEWLASDLADPGLIGPGETLITDVAPLATATATDLSYVEPGTPVKTYGDTAAGCLIVAPGDAAEIAERLSGRALLVGDDPQAAFIAAMMRLRPARPRPDSRIALDAYLAPTARVGERCYVGANVSIGADSKIGDDCQIHPGAYLGDGVTLGDGCVVHPNAVIYRDCRIGDRVLIHANAVIGADGFGYRFVEGRYEKIPHTGRVVIEDDCEIGACTTIDRGMIADTVIGEGTKLDNLVMIAHNCRLGPHNAAAGHVGLAGSVTTGAYARFGGHAGVADHLTIGTGANIGAKAGVASDIPDGATFHGIPARPATEALREMMMVGKLPEMRKQLKALQTRLDAIELGVTEAETGTAPGESRRAA